MEDVNSSATEKRYRIKCKIGDGATGCVYVARDILMQRDVAVKTYTVNDQKAMKFFDSEARALTMLSHPNIVDVYDTVRHKNMSYIVMEYIDGITLSEYVKKKGRLSVRECLNLTAQVLSALIAAHASNIIHRDIKPENIMIDKSGRVKLTDFGISQTSELDSFKSEVKGVGSVFYISPEQAMGLPLDRRCDIYSLGVVMYELLTGDVPFLADSASTIAAMHISSLPAPIETKNKEVPIRVIRIVNKALEKERNNRYSDAVKMRKDVVKAAEKLEKDTKKMQKKAARAKRKKIG